MISPPDPSSSSTPPEKDYDRHTVDTALVARALGDEFNLLILDIVARTGKTSATMLSGNTGCSLTKASRHLNSLALAGILHKKREDQSVYYGLRTETLKTVVKWVDQVLLLNSTPKGEDKKKEKQ